MGFLTGKTVIITGGGRAVLRDGRCGSIGYGIATAYAKEGANIVITGRNVQKLTDAKEEQFPEGIALCCIPKAPEPWMSPLVDFIPGSLMGGYVAALQNKLFFTGRYDYRTQTWKV